MVIFVVEPAEIATVGVLPETEFLEYPYSIYEEILATAEIATVNELGDGVPTSLDVTGTAAIARESGDATATPKIEALRKFRRLKKENGLLIFLHTPHCESFQLDQQIAYSPEKVTRCTSHDLLSHSMNMSDRKYLLKLG